MNFQFESLKNLCSIVVILHFAWKNYLAKMFGTLIYLKILCHIPCGHLERESSFRPHYATLTVHTWISFNGFNKKRQCFSIFPQPNQNKWQIIHKMNSQLITLFTITKRLFNNHQCLQSSVNGKWSVYSLYVYAYLRYWCTASWGLPKCHNASPL